MMEKLKLEKKLLSYYVFTFLILVVGIGAVSADGEINLVADRINYYDSEQHTITVTNNGESADTLEFNLPGGWSFVSGDGCVNNPPITCVVPSEGSVNFTLESNGNADEYAIDIVSIQNSANSYTGNSVYFLRIHHNEIFHTLVEFGRGRGNYFFDTLGMDQGPTCQYLPDNSMIELSYLHKVHPIIQYYGFSQSVGSNIQFTCTYPENTIVRQHLTDSIARENDLWNITYKITELTGSWERMGYLSMQFSATDYVVDEFITINCTDISYYLERAGGYVSINEDSFTLTFRDREPFIASAETGVTIGQGTQEVIVRYNITNDELYTAENVVMEIRAPRYGTFIGVRGELWGSSQGIYRFERSSMHPGDSEIIDLVVRFDTTGVTDITSINLSEGIVATYRACWEANAYNPLSYTQVIEVTGTGDVDSGISTEIISIQERLNEIFDIANIINHTTQINNQTLLQIVAITELINETTQQISSDITNVMIPSLVKINNTLTNVQSLAGDIIDLLDCTNEAEGTVCDKLNNITTNIVNLESEVTDQNELLIEKLNETIAYRFDLVDGNLTNLLSFSETIISDISDVNDLLTCEDSAEDTVCNKLDNLDIFMTQINNTITEIKILAIEINTTTQANNVLLETINVTTNNILNNVDSLNTSLEIFRLEVQELVNCSVAPDSPLCMRLETLNTTVNNIWGISNEINNTVTDVQIHLEDNMSLAMQRFNNIDANLTILRGDVGAVNNLVNCTVEVESGICNRLFKMNITIDEINRTANHALDVITFINETRWGNLTAAELFDLMNDTQETADNLLYRVTTMQEFNAELVFLVTDAFGMQVAAQTDVNQGMYSSAIEKLNSANSKLEEASHRILAMEREIVDVNVEQPRRLTDTSSFINWRTALLILATLIILSTFIKVPVKREGY